MSNLFLYGFGAVYLCALVFSLRHEGPEFRPWEHLYDEETHRFEPDRSITMAAVGDLGRESWIRELQIEKQVTFTTDAWGLRNLDAVERPDIVVLGDSYLVGSGSSDSQTLTARMSQQLETTVYNFGVQSVDVPALFLQDGRFAGNPPRVVVWAPVSRNIRPRPLFFPQSSAEPAPPLERIVRGYRDVGDAIRLTKERVNRDNRLSVQARYAYNGWLYRLRGHENLIHPEGDSGAPALALSIESQGLHVPADVRGVGDTVAMVAAYSQFMTQHGIRFIYCPIPESATIYPELFANRDQIVSPSFLDILLSELAAAGVATVDLRPVFAANKEPYLYHWDDSHWNPRAIDLAAAAISEQISSQGHEPPP